MATVDSDKVVCGGIHTMIVAVLVLQDYSVCIVCIELSIRQL
jgi:hypothetical protein